MISGRTTLIAHLGYPTKAFKAPMIYNPYFEKAGIDAVVMPMGIMAPDYPSFLRELFNVTNIRGALVTMPHKKTTIDLADEVSPTARIAGAANALLKRDDGTLLADMFDGEGFVRGVRRKGTQPDQRERAGHRLRWRRVSHRGVTGCRRGVANGPRRRRRRSGRIARQPVGDALPRTVGQHRVGRPHRLRHRRERDPLGMNEGDPLPIDMSRVAPTTFVGEVVMKTEITPFLRAARERGCETQVGTDMLFEQIPAYLEFFGFGTTTPDELRSVSQLQY